MYLILEKVHVITNFIDSVSLVTCIHTCTCMYSSNLYSVFPKACLIHALNTKRKWV